MKKSEKDNVGPATHGFVKKNGGKTTRIMN